MCWASVFHRSIGAARRTEDVLEACRIHVPRAIAIAHLGVATRHAPPDGIKGAAGGKKKTKKKKRKTARRSLFRTLLFYEDGGGGDGGEPEPESALGVPPKPLVFATPYMEEHSRKKPTYGVFRGYN